MENIALDEMVDEAFEQRMDCEVMGHFSMPDLHSGDGEWYVTLTCPYSDCDWVDVTLTCNKYRNFILTETAATRKVGCPGCERREKFDMFFESMVRKP